MAEIFLSILTVSVSMIPIITVTMILTPLLNRIYKYSWTYWMWLIISIRLILPFTLTGKSLVNIKFPSANSLISGNIPLHKDLIVEKNLVNAVNTSRLNFNMLEIIALIYCIGAILFIMFNLLNYIKFRKAIEKHCSKPKENIIKAVVNVGQMNGINIEKKKLNILISNKIPGPMVVGIFKPMLLLPADDYDYIELKMILSHEMIHIKRYDTAYKFLLLMVCAIHWFNPIVHIMSHKANNDMELSCDIKALHEASAKEKKIYSLMIIKIASQSYKCRIPSLFTSFGSKKSNLKTRINNIFSSAYKKEGHIILILVFLLIILFGTAIKIGNVVTDVAADQYTQPSANAEGNSYNYAKNDSSNTDINEFDNNKEDNFNENSNDTIDQQNKNSNSSQISNKITDEEKQQNINSSKDGNVSNAETEIVIIDLNKLSESMDLYEE